MPNVLIIEDSSFQRKFLSKTIGEAGHHVIMATNGREGLEKIVAELPDVVICDLLMPEMGGLEVLEELRTRNIDIPILILSADIQDSIRDKALGLGVIDFLNKPITEEALIVAVDKALSARSNVGQGSTFTFRLPALESAIPKSKSDKIKPGNGKILVMDDDDTIRMGLEVFLAELGYEVTTSINGEEAIGAYTRELEAGSPFDAVILDLTIPGGMGGVETLQNLQKINREVTAIVSSGYSNDPIMAEYKDHGFSGVLMKPFRPADLAQVLSDTLSRGD